MPKRGKKYEEAKKLVDPNKKYTLRGAIELVKKMCEVAKRNFDETVELAVRLGVDPRHADQMVRGSVVLPHGTGRSVRVLVFAKGDKAKEALEAGADYVGAEDLVEKIQKEGWLDFDKAVATPDMMGIVGRLGKILGPRGLMPNPKTGTVTMEIYKVVQDLKKGMVEFRVDKSGNIHVPIGKQSFDVDKLYENAKSVIEALLRAKPSTSKGQYIRGVAVSSTMGPGVKVDPNQVLEEVRK